MVAGLVWLGAALVLGQGQTQAPAAGADEAWLQSVPTDVQIVVRVRNMQAARDDLVKMLEAMSPTLSANYRPTIDQAVTQFSQRYGKAATNAPMLFMFRLPRPDAIGTPPYAFIIQSTDYMGVIRQLAGPNVNPKPEKREGGYDEIKCSDGLPMFTYKGSNYIAFSNEEKLMGEVVKPPKTLVSTLSDTYRKRLMSGDAGVYLNLDALYTRYKDSLEQIRQQLGGAAADAAQQKNAGPDVRQAFQSLMASAFNAFKDARSLAVSLDFAPTGLESSGAVDTKPGSDTSKLLTGPKTASGEELARMPVNLTNYIFFNGRPEAIEKLLSSDPLAMIGAGGEPPAEVKRALELQHQAGIQSTATSLGISDRGVEGITLTVFADPKKAIDAMTAMAQALKTVKGPSKDLIKEISVKPKAQSYQGFELTESTITWNVAKFDQVQPNQPEVGAMLRSTLGDATSNWFGTDGKHVLTVVARDWNRAKAMIDAVKTGQGSIGETASYKSVRPKLPAENNGIFLMSAQGFVQQVATRLSGLAGNQAQIKVPGDLPKDPILFGGAYTSSPGAATFSVVVPSPVGPVLEKGLSPIFQALQGRVNQ